MRALIREAPALAVVLAFAALPASAALAAPVERVAGTGTAGFGGDGGPARAAMLNSPRGVAALPDGRVAIADTANNRVRVIAGATITTLAGTGQLASSGDGGPASAASIGDPRGLAAAEDGSVYVAEPYRVRAIAPDGTIRAVAGTGIPGLRGDGGPATQARLGEIGGIAVGPGGDLYLSDDEHGVIRRVDQTGTISTFASGLGSPAGLSVSSDSGLVVADAGAGLVRRITADGVATTLAGGGSVLDAETGTGATTLAIVPVAAIVLDTHLVVLTAEGDPDRSPQPARLLIFNAGRLQQAVDASACTVLCAPAGLAAGPGGSVLIADTGANAIARLSSGAAVIASPPQLAAPANLAADGTLSFTLAEVPRGAVRVVIRVGNHWRPLSARLIRKGRKMRIKIPRRWRRHATRVRVVTGRRRLAEVPIKRAVR
jgi:trimeric autotransporter adhesin